MVYLSAYLVIGLVFGIHGCYIDKGVEFTDETERALVMCFATFMWLPLLIIVMKGD